MMTFVCISLWPLPSLTVSCTVYLPASAYEYCGFSCTLVPLPSPKSQSYAYGAAPPVTIAVNVTGMPGHCGSSVVKSTTRLG